MAPDDREEALIPRKWGPLISAGLTVAASLLVWLLGVASSVDQRIKDLELKMNHLVDQNGEVRPSKTAIDAITSLRVLEARVNDLEKVLRVPSR